MAISPNGWKQVCGEQDVIPKPRFSLRTKREIYLGYRSALLGRASRKMPPDQYKALREWIYAWLNQEINEDA